MLVILGSISLALGIIGIFLPLLPTTPFLLLSAACYAKSSRPLYNRLVGNKYFGSYIKNWREGKGIPLKSKILAVILLIISMGYSAVFWIKFVPAKIMMAVVAAAVSAYILTRPTYKK